MVLNDNEFDDMLEEITHRFARANVDRSVARYRCDDNSRYFVQAAA